MTAALDRALPANLDGERLVLGSIQLNDAVYQQVAGAVGPDDFSIEKHRRIFARMKDLYDRGERIDRVTVADELMKLGQLETVDGLGYLVSVGLVPHTRKWLEYWDRQFYLYLSGQDQNSLQNSSIEAYRAVMKCAEDNTASVARRIIEEPYARENDPQEATCGRL